MSPSLVKKSPNFAVDIPFSDCLTYANPLSIPSIPRGSDHVGNGFSGLPHPDYRSISDPSVMLHDGRWYLYPSYGMTWVSEDFVHWDYVPCNIPCEPGYSPTVVPSAGRFWMTRHSDGLYVADSPTGPFASVGDFILPDGAPLRPVDPAFFLDDDGSLYLYWFGMEGNPLVGGRSFTLGARLDAENPQRVLTKPVLLNAFDPSHEWERFGPYGQDDRWGYIEGQWMLKHNGRYYLVYASSGTEFPSYAMGAYYSDEGPLSGFVYQRRNPIVSSRAGLVRGGGHGSIVHAPDGSLWAFYTIPMPCAHLYERRIGMDRVEVDENGELYCPGVTETPQFGPCQPRKGDTGLRPLTFFLRFSHRASSQTEGHEAFYALDDSLITYWLPAADDARPTLEIDLGTAYRVSASRIVWRDVGLDYAAGVTPGPFRYRIDVAADSPDDEAGWTTAFDASGNAEDLAVDYRRFPSVTGRYVRLVVVGWPQCGTGRIRPGVVSFTAFGNREPPPGGPQ